MSVMSVEEIVAYQGELEFAGCSWTDTEGWRVRFLVVQDPDAVDKANPFKAFTKRSGDKPGTRFTMACGFNDETLEAMLTGWGDSARGWSVVFAFDYKPDFVNSCARRTADAAGTRFMAVFVEIADDETPVNQKAREKLETKPKRLSGTAAILCKKPAFWKWLNSTQWLGKSRWPLGIASETDAAGAIKLILNIDSRGELDSDRMAGPRKRFNEMHQKYLEWAGEVPHEFQGL